MTTATTPKPPEILVVMPVFNEEASVEKVVREWFCELENCAPNFALLAISDGSTDRSLAILQRLREQLGERLTIIARENRGHGQSCLEGYRAAIERGIPFVFQIDSDGQCDPQFFHRLWRERERFDVIYGKRVRRDDGWRRVIASIILRLTLLVFARANCADANTPYRLMRTGILRDLLPRIPADFFLANVALAVLLRRKKSVRELAVPIRFRARFGGEPLVKIGAFGSRARQLIAQLRALR